MITSIAFGIVALCALLSAIFVILSDNLIRAALWLGVSLLATAVAYAMLGASFLAGVQVLLYVGGVMTLLVFGVMMTRKHDGIVVVAESKHSLWAAMIAALLFGVVAAAIQNTPELNATPPNQVVTIPELGRAILDDHVFSFELLSLLLLGAILGAIVLARRRDPGVAATQPGRLPAASSEASL